MIRKARGSLRLAVRGSCLVTFAVVTLTSAGTSAAAGERRPELPSPTCDGIQAPPESTVRVHVYAVGVQMYRWNGDSWTFVGPRATLFSDPCHENRFGSHYGEDGEASRPAWEAADGSKVLGAHPARCSPDPGAIPWLGLGAASSSGPGLLEGVTYIQRVDTVGGTVPGHPGSRDQELASVPYTAEYYFYLPTAAASGH